MSDINKHSFNGPDDNGKGINLGDVYLDPKIDWASAIKCTSQLRDFTLKAQSVPGGHDAVVDINNQCNGISVGIETAFPNGQFLTTIKGGSKNITLSVGRLYGHGKVCDVMLGDWSDQSHKRVENVTLDIHSPPENGPVTVIWLGSTRPILAPGSGPYKFIGLPRCTPQPVVDLTTYVFYTLRRWGFFRSQAN